MPSTISSPPRARWRGLVLSLAPALVPVLGLVLALAGCGKHTYLVVRIESDGSLPPVYGIRVALKLSPPNGPTVQSVGTLPSATNTAVVPLPTSAAFRLDDADGALDVTAQALDLKGSSLAEGTVHTTVAHAQTWSVTVRLATSQALTAPGLEGEPASAAATEGEPASGSAAGDEGELESHAHDPSWVPATTPP